MSQELGVPVDQVAKAGEQAAQPWWVEGVSGTAGLGKLTYTWPSDVVDGYVVCVCVHMNECVLAALWVT